MVWFGLVWFGLVWFGLVWFGLVSQSTVSRSGVPFVAAGRSSRRDKKYKGRLIAGYQLSYEGKQRERGQF